MQVYIVVWTKVNATNSQLRLDATINELEIKYIVSDRCPPVYIQNDVVVHLFLDQKKLNTDFFPKYPLCITLKNLTINNPESSFVMARRNKY